ncbi:phosphoribosylglycinamide formyltransferase [Humidisolicoccus flavus]|uniref:phosphoribosylglycinamide formyltransferase n=1 Tax=Humidisolicoccus flavus TaxID=3111414 RepID=UPI00324B5EFC
MLRLVVLVSGAGSNLLDLLERIENGSVNAEVVAVGADNDCPALQHAHGRSIPTFVERFSQPREQWSEALGDHIASFTPDLVVLSGFMRLLSASTVERFSPNIINTHPAYLPEFPGAHGVRDALAAGVAQTGASVIVVDAGVDSGPILAQERVAVLPDDTEASLHDRIKPVERELLARVITEFATSSTNQGAV